jgi:uncharacterized protein YaaR (DUF327 family)
MPDKKLTNKEIVKALEHCCENNNCEGCPFDYLTFSSQCASELAIKSLDLINHQDQENESLKAENERLKKLLEQCEDNGEYWESKYKTAKAEAYKECIEKVKKEIAEALKNNYDVRSKRIAKVVIGSADEFISYCEGKIDCLRGLDDFLDNLLKELVGESN